MNYVQDCRQWSNHRLGMDISLQQSGRHGVNALGPETGRNGVYRANDPYIN
jgi:hypothetical protein